MKKHSTEELYCGLRALEESMFPKKCCTCGRVYETMADYIQQTKDVHDSTGLMAVKGSKKLAMIGFFRNCVCNSTLLVPCKDRRGETENQLKRRKIFGDLLDTLEKTGWKRNEARTELLKFMRGEESRVLDALSKKK